MIGEQRDKGHVTIADPHDASVRAILFDAVDTLIYPHPPAVDVYHEVGGRFGTSLSRDEVGQRFATAFRRHCDDAPTDEARERRRWRDIVADVFEALPDPEGELFESLWNHFATPTSWRCFDDVAPAWAALEERGVWIGIASNFDERLFSIVRQTEPLARAQHVFVSSQVGYPKPRREFFHAIEDELQLPPANLLLVGDDRRNDQEGAQQAGWHTLLIDRTGEQGDISSLRALV